MVHRSDLVHLISDYLADTWESQVKSTARSVEQFRESSSVGDLRNAGFTHQNKPVWYTVIGHADLRSYYNQDASFAYATILHNWGLTGQINKRAYGVVIPQEIVDSFADIPDIEKLLTSMLVLEADQYITYRDEGNDIGTSRALATIEANQSFINALGERGRSQLYQNLIVPRVNNFVPGFKKWDKKILAVNPAVHNSHPQQIMMRTRRAGTFAITTNLKQEFLVFVAKKELYEVPSMVDLMMKQDYPSAFGGDLVENLDEMMLLLGDAKTAYAIDLAYRTVKSQESVAGNYRYDQGFFRGFLSAMRQTRAGNRNRSAQRAFMKEFYEQAIEKLSSWGMFRELYEVGRYGTELGLRVGDIEQIFEKAMAAYPLIMPQGNFRSNVTEKEITAVIQGYEQIRRFIYDVEKRRKQQATYDVALIQDLILAGYPYVQEKDQKRDRKDGHAYMTFPRKTISRALVGLIEQDRNNWYSHGIDGAILFAASHLVYDTPLSDFSPSGRDPLRQQLQNLDGALDRNYAVVNRHTGKRLNANDIEADHLRLKKAISYYL